MLLAAADRWPEQQRDRRALSLDCGQPSSGLRTARRQHAAAQTRRLECCCHRAAAASCAIQKIEAIGALLKKCEVIDFRSSFDSSAKTAKSKMPPFAAPAAASASSSRERERGPTLLSSLPNLQNLIKRDPQSYTDEFLIQLGHYNSLRTIIEHGIATSASGAAVATSSQNTGKAGHDEERFRELVGFVAQVRTTSDRPSLKPKKLIVPSPRPQLATRNIRQTSLRISRTSCSAPMPTSLRTPRRLSSRPWCFSETEV